jgi:hypothetical protein
MRLRNGAQSGWERAHSTWPHSSVLERKAAAHGMMWVIKLFAPDI